MLQMLLLLTSTEANTATSEGATESSADLPEANILHTNDVHGRNRRRKGCDW